ncbi:FtsX-like permease family protein [Candidatus Parcubacteria bacterium]|jgi:ABC-type lipoprotein release transport system permease subunit|nr:MAG: FtsX-like permease family protein [Candidatus Parcubacteria bacterium]
MFWRRHQMGKLGSAAKVGFFLATRQIKRASIWTNVLVVCVMVLTFLNLVVVSGILVGLIEGATQAVQKHYIGDVFITPLKEKNYIERSSIIMKTIRSIPGVSAVSGRYISSGNVEAEYKKAKKNSNDKGNEVSTTFVGIDPIDEDAVSGLSRLVIEGEYLNRNDYDRVLVGGMLLKKYLDYDSTTFPALSNINVGDKIRITVNGNVREVFVKGITKSKVDEIDRRIFFVDSQFRGLVGRDDYNLGEISIVTKQGVSPFVVKQALLANHFDDYSSIKAGNEAEPKFIQDLRNTFSMLGTAISSIGLIVAAITIFIVIFINAVTRRKFIGILKGIGIRPVTIEWAYIFQAFFYATAGTIIGLVIVFGILKPYFDANPINFPFSDGILVATASGTLIRIAVLFLATLIAGYIPVKIITRQNTLDAILNR